MLSMVDGTTLENIFELRFNTHKLCRYQMVEAVLMFDAPS